VNPVDIHLQRRRIAAALRWIPAGGHVLDVGCADGALFDRGRPRIASGVGIDTRDGQPWVDGPFEQRTGSFPEALHPDDRFDAVVMLAVVEHLHDEELHHWAAAVPAALNAGGRLIITTPSPSVDHILAVGMRLRLLDGMEAHQHHGFEPGEVPRIFSVPGLALEHRSRFELGFNHLFVFSATP
jgi:2-polyprenyl-3-methyl-5-hydroxy-6-metoxy-1,4-benzoquinol methylase